MSPSETQLDVTSGVDSSMRQTKLALAAVMALAMGPLAVGQEKPREPQIPDLKIDTYTLPNGLKVILHEDHTTPVVGVNLYYRVGSKDEKAGRTGFAHLFEHLMFQGSANHDAEYFGPLESIGANINGTTNTDRTNYFETVPSNGLERALWLEADRMGFLLPALTQEKLDNQRDVVKNERRQSYENRPYGMAYFKMLEAMFPEGHPYRHSTIGSMADLSAASLEDVSNFFRTYYTPNNCTLVIAGDFDPAEARSLVEKYFGPIPRGPDIEPMEPQVPTLDEPKHVTMTDKVALARSELSWPTVPRGHADEPALDVLAAVLGQLDKENRLYRSLMYDEQLASDVSASHPTSMLAGSFDVTVTARPEVELDELIARVEAEIERLKQEGPTALEVSKAQTSRESGLVYGLEDVGRKADFLNSYNAEFGDPLAYKQELKDLFAVTPADVQRVARQYLTEGRVRLDVLPGEKATLPEDPEVDRSSQVAITPEPPPIEDTFDRGQMPGLAETPSFSPPPFERRRLSNGLEVLIAERRNLPIVTLGLVFKGGQALDPAGKEGQTAMMADLLTEGTESLDSLALAGALAEIGSSLSASSDRDSTRLSLTTLTKNIDRGLELFADVLLNPSFPEKELERLRKEKLAALLQRKDSPAAIAGTVFPKLLFGADHPYGRIDTVASVEAIERAGIVASYEQLFQPDNAQLLVAGDVTADEIVARFETILGDWKSKSAPIEQVIPDAPRTATRLYLVDKPGTPQSVLYAGHSSVPRSTPDYFPIEVLNSILGGQFSSRINLNLREEKGYTYGARSMFVMRRGGGLFLAGGSFQTAVTAPALVELVKELSEIRGSRPATAEELEFAVNNIVKGFPAEFSTTFQLAGKLAELAVFELPTDYFTTFQENVEGVTTELVTAAATKHLVPDDLVIVVVGDRSQIEPSLRALPFVKQITIVDEEGNPIEEPEAKRAASE